MFSVVAVGEEYDEEQGWSFKIGGGFAGDKGAFEERNVSSRGISGEWSPRLLFPNVLTDPTTSSSTPEYLKRTFSTENFITAYIVTWHVGCQKILCR